MYKLFFNIKRCTLVTIILFSQYTFTAYGKSNRHSRGSQASNATLNGLVLGDTCGADCHTLAANDRLLIEQVEEDAVQARIFQEGDNTQDKFIDSSQSRNQIQNRNKRRAEGFKKYKTPPSGRELPSNLRIKPLVSRTEAIDTLIPIQEAPERKLASHGDNGGGIIKHNLSKAETIKFRKTHNLSEALFSRYILPKSKDYQSFPEESEKDKYRRITLSDYDHKEEYDQILSARLGGNKRISLDIAEDVHIKDVLLDISKLAGINIQINPLVDGYIILSLKDKTVYEVFKRIADVAHLKITVEGDVIRIEPDLPKTINYTVGFLDLQRKSSTSYNLSTAVDAAGSGGGSDSISSSHENSLWESIEVGLKGLLASFPDSDYSINKQAGIVSVTGSGEAQRNVKSYIKKVKKFATTQILIEMKLVEVELKDEFRSGINWEYDGGKGGGRVNGLFKQPGQSSKVNLANATDNFTYSLPTSGSITAAVEMVSAFGNTKTISSPKLSVLNNQQSIISFATNHVYFEVKPKIQNQYINASSTAVPTAPIIVTSVMKTIPIGVILSIQAVADPDTKEIIMSVRPSISEITGEVEDPAAAFLNDSLSSGAKSQIKNLVPIVKKREMDAVLRLKSGKVMVIGGFTNEYILNKRVGFPILKDIPIIGLLFGGRQKVTVTSEMLIFIKATIVPNNTFLTRKDQEFYDSFAGVGVEKDQFDEDPKVRSMRLVKESIL